MPDLARTPTPPPPAVRDPALRAYQRRYFVLTGRGTVRRAFTSAGATRIAARPPAARRTAIRDRWNLAVQREAAHRRALGL